MDMKIDFCPAVQQAVAAENYNVYAYMNDGSVRLINVKKYVDEKPVFAPLKDYSVFTQTLTVMNQTVAWDLSGKRDPYNCLDIDPVLIYECPAVNDPLAR